MYHVHKCGSNNPWKCSSVCFRSQDTGCTCVHMDLLGDRGNNDRGRARKESSSRHAWDARLSFVAQLLLLLCVGIHSDVLDLTFQGLIIWGTVMWKLANTRQVQAPRPISSTQPRLAQKPPLFIPFISPAHAMTFSEMKKKQCPHKAATWVEKEMGRMEKIYGLGKEEDL